MNSIMVFLYDIVLRVYAFGVLLATPFWLKAKLWREGRKTSKTKLLDSLSGSSVIWMHCASLGEFEQGRPVLELLKTKWPTYKILLTFFSPSGYEIRKNYELAACIAYLPIDTKANARWFVTKLNIKAAIFVKYDLWYHYLHELQKKNVPTFLVSALFRQNQFYFKPYGKFLRNKIAAFDHIFLQEESSRKLLQDYKIMQTSIAGDTRIDRVYAIDKNAKSFPLIEAFKKDSKVLIAGSTWPADETILCPFINQKKDKNLKFILAPHQVDLENIQRIEKLLTVNCIRYSNANEVEIRGCQVLIIDNIGMLSAIYQYAWVVYIGGGFGSGLHNTLEPAAFGRPLIFGPKYDKFSEAVEMVIQRSAISIKTDQEFIEAIKTFENQNFYNAAANNTRQYIEKHKGASTKVVKKINEYLAKKV